MNVQECVTKREREYCSTIFKMMSESHASSVEWHVHEYDMNVWWDGSWLEVLVPTVSACLFQTFESSWIDLSHKVQLPQWVFVYLINVLTYMYVCWSSHIVQDHLTSWFQIMVVFGCFQSCDFAFWVSTRYSISMIHSPPLCYILMVHSLKWRHL